jgi:hypothetical protein
MAYKNLGHGERALDEERNVAKVTCNVACNGVEAIVGDSRTNGLAVEPGKAVS